MHFETMSATHAVVFILLLAAVIGFFPMLDALREWRWAKRHRTEQARQRKQAKRDWRRLFAWTVFSTRRVPRITDQRDSAPHGRQ